jgi:3-hydroxybutyryl-CoA dehydratase
MMAVFFKHHRRADIVLFAGVSGDCNAIHINEECGDDALQRDRIAHGFLSASVISAAVANRLPAPAPSTWTST